MNINIGDRFKTSWVMYEVYEIMERGDVDDFHCKMRVIEKFGKEAAMIGSTIIMSHVRLEKVLELRLFISQQKQDNFKSLYSKLK